MEINKNYILHGLNTILIMYTDIKKTKCEKRIKYYEHVMEGFILALAGIIDFPVKSFETLIEQHISIEDRVKLIYVFAKAKLPKND